MDSDSLANDLNRQTAKIRWKELEKFFAMGVVITVASRLDLIAAASEFANDNKAKIEQWLSEGSVSKAKDQEAALWQAENTLFWVVVVDPWVLIQPV